MSAAAVGSAQAPRRARRARRPARPSGQHAGARAAAGAGRPGRAAASAPFLSDGLDGRIYRDAFYEPYAAWYPELPRERLRRAAVAGGGGRRRDVARLPHPPGDGDDVRDRRLQPVPVDHALPQQPGLPGHRPGAAGGRAVRTGAVAWTRGSAAVGGDRRSTSSAPAWPLWLLRFECAAIYGASGLSKLVDPDWFGGTVTWQRVSRARDQLEAWPLPDWAVSLLTDRGFHTGRGQVRRAHRAVHRGRPVVATHPLRGRVGRRRLPPLDRAVGGGAGLLVPRHRRAGDLGGAVHPRSGAPHRPHGWSPASIGRAGTWARLAGPLSRRAGSGRFPAGGRGPRRHRDPRRAGRRVRAEPPAADGVVRPPGAAPARRPPGPRERHDDRGRASGGPA